MGNRINFLNDPDQLIQKILPHFSFSKKLGDE